MSPERILRRRRSADEPPRFEQCLQIHAGRGGGVAPARRDDPRHEVEHVTPSRQILVTIGVVVLFLAALLVGTSV